MYGGLGMGGMGGMGSMYGGGLGMGSSMYGGGMGMGGMGSSMYGGGLGMGGGMYGSGGGMYGSGGGMYGSGGGMYGSSGLGGGGMSSFGRNNQLGTSSGMNGMNGIGGGALTNDGMQGNGAQSPLNLQPTDPSNQLASPINQNASPLPPLNESPEERSRRIQAEHKKERQLIRQQREQHKQARLQARMEIAGHFTNILVQGLRSAMELFGVCFGTYYSMKAVRAFSSMQPGMGMGMMGGSRYGGNMMQQQQQQQAAAAAAAAAKPQQVAASAGPSRWRTWLLCIALFILGEVAYSIATRQRAKPPQRRRRITGPTEDAYGNVISPDEYEVSIRSTDDESELSEREEEGMSDAWGQAYNSNANGVYGGPQGIRSGEGNGVRRVYYALYDYQAPQDDGSCLSFKAGDEFVVEEYAEGSWCEAMAVEGGNYAPRGRRGLVPSNFLRLAERATKL